MHRGLASLGLVLATVVLVGCDPGQQAWVDNESPQGVIVSIDGTDAVLVRVGVHGLAYSRLGPDSGSHRVSVFTSECALLASTNIPTSSAWLIRITVRSDGGVEFDHGASLSSLATTGSITPTQGCPSD